MKNNLKFFCFIISLIICAGAWSAEDDSLVKSYIKKYEGKVQKTNEKINTLQALPLKYNANDQIELEKTLESTIARLELEGDNLKNEENLKNLERELELVNLGGSYYKLVNYTNNNIITQLKGLLSKNLEQADVQIEVEKVISKFKGRDISFL